MGTGAEVVAYAALAASAASSYMQYESSQDVARKQKEAGKAKTADQLQADLAAKRQAAREERVRRARIAQAAENTGVAGSSGESGALGALSQQLATATAFQTGQQSASLGISRTLQKASNAQSDAATWGAIGQVANSVFGATGGSLFDANTKSTTSSTPTQKKISSPDGRFSIFD
jgi:hypothetical protein